MRYENFQDTLEAFVGELESHGVVDILSGLFPIAPLVSRARMTKMSDRLEEPLRSFIKVFLVGEFISIERFAGTDFELLIPELVRQGILTYDSAELKIGTRGIVLMSVGGLLMFIEKPHYHPTLYYGDESFALLSRLQFFKGKRVLDLCCGPGAQGLSLAATNSHVTLSDVNPLAVALCEINATLNKLGNVDVLHSNVFDSVPKEASFDLIVCNPPLLPCPISVRFPFVGHGGDDGLRVTREVIEGLPEYLADGGSSYISSVLVMGGELDSIEKLRKMVRCSGMSVDVQITAKYRVDVEPGVLQMLAATASATNKNEYERNLEKMRGHFNRASARFLCPAILKLRKSRTTEKVQVADFSDDGTASLMWYL